MYGYGGDGTVVAPTGSAYQIQNSSTYTDYKEVDGVYACYGVIQITSNTDIDSLSLKDATGIDSATITSGAYGYYNKENTNYLVKLSSCSKHSENSGCKHYKTVDGVTTEDYEYTYFYKDTDPNASCEMNVNGATEKIYKGVKLYAADEKCIALNIPTIKAEVMTWNIQPTDKINQLKAGEIAMTINNLDLSDVNKADGNTLDIKDLGWKINAATKNDDGEITSNGALDLPVAAAIAGGNVNEEGCAPVVRVTYTVTPDIESISETSYTTYKAPQSE
jgi:hypothetical protein